MRTFVEAGLLGRGIFIPQGFDPDTLVKERGAQSFAGLIEAAELLVDYFVRSEAAAAGTSVSGRARAAEHVAELLALVSNAFEFDLLTRKAAEMLGVREEVLRAQGRKGAGAPMRTSVAAASAQLPVRSGPRYESGRGVRTAGGGGGISGIARGDPCQRRAVRLRRLANLAGMTAELCGSGDELGTGSSDANAYPRQQSALSEQMMDPSLESVESARRMIRDVTLPGAGAVQARAERSKDLVATARQGQKSANEGEAIAALEAVMRLRKVQPKVSESTVDSAASGPAAETWPARAAAGGEIMESRNGHF